MTDTTAVPTAHEAPASGQPSDADLLANQNAATGEPGAADQPEGEGDQPKQKPEKTPEQRRIDNLQRSIDRRTRNLADTRAENQQLRAELDRLRGSSGGDTLRAPDSDDEPVSLSRTQLDEMVKREAQRLAPTLKQQEAEIEYRKGVVTSLTKDLGQERFDELAADLDEALGGLVERDGRTPRPAADAIFHADDPKAVIEYLADPENEAEADRIGRMSHLQAGRAIAQLEAKLASAAAANKPQRSNAPKPIETTRGQGGVTGTPDPSSPGYMDWKLKQLGGR